MRAGARFLRERRFPERVVNLVDLLWYADMTVGPDGQRVSLPARMAELRERYPADHHIVRALAVNWPQRELAVQRAEAWISDVGLTHV